MNVKEIENDSNIQNWLAEKAGSKKTRDAYTIGVSAFTEYIGISPSELIQKSRDETRAGMFMSERETTLYLSKFRNYLEEEKEYAPFTVKTRMTAVFSFYRFHEMPVPDMKKTKRKAHPDPKHHNRIDKEDIRKLLKHADPLERAIVLSGCAGGLAQNEIRNLKVIDFENGYDATTGVTTLRLVREKTGFPFTTFLTPEASQAVVDYLNYRERECIYTEQLKIDHLEKQRIIRDRNGKPDKIGYLFIRRRIQPEYLLEKNPKTREKMRQLEERTIMDIYKALNMKAETSTDKGEWNKLRSHNSRKFFFNSLDGKINSDKLEYMMAHEVEGTKRFYKWDIDIDELKNEYIKQIPFLTIEKALDPEQHPDFIRLKQESETYARAAATAAVERSEYIEMKAELEKFRAEAAEREAENTKRDELLAELMAVYLPENMENMRKRTKEPGAIDDAVDYVYEDMKEHGN